MTRPILADLHGEALDEALGRCFSLATETVDVAGRAVTLVKPENADHLISEADYVMDERLPYWADLWPSARVLSATMAREAGAGRRLLEMGCGLGLATVGAMLGGFEVTATDYYEDALHVTRGNAARNLGHEPMVRIVNWREWPMDLGVFDVVMAADVLYEKVPYPLPVTLEIGDKLLIEGTGAYTSTYSSVAFNGIPPLKTYHI
jgi:2-polyprenyl-3-methyl-5-hydroxy-6-metoxy-1,4-benzoquinol methylase